MTERRPWRTLLPGLWVRQHGRCHSCGAFCLMARDAAGTPGAAAAPGGRWVVLWGQTYPAATVEHLVPRAAGGATTDLDNLRMSCRPCNDGRNRQSQADRPAAAPRRRRPGRGRLPRPRGR